MQNGATNRPSEKSFKCSLCPKICTRAAARRDHQNKHAGARPYACTNAGCDKTFTSRDLRRTHEATHIPIASRPRRHRCSICPQRFDRACTLRRHERDIHAGDGADRSSEITRDNAHRHHSAHQDGVNEIYHDRADIRNGDDTSRSGTTQDGAHRNHSVYQDRVNEMHHDRMSETFRNDGETSQSPIFDLNETVYTSVQSTWTPHRPSRRATQDPTEETTRQAFRGETSCYELLLKYEYSPLWYEEAWFVAAEEGNADALLFIHTVAEVNINLSKEFICSHRTALGIAASKGHCKALGLLLSRGADINLAMGLWREQPFRPGIEADRKACISTLIAHGFDVDKKDSWGNTCLKQAMQNRCSIGIFNVLLQKTKNINEKNQVGRTILHYAACEEDNSYLSLALEYGADISATDNYDWTVLHSAALKSREGNVRLILEGSNMVNVRNFDQETALHLVGRMFFSNDRDSSRCIDLLLSNGAEVNAVDKNGNTPLMRACNRSMSVSERLLEYGASVNHVNKDGLTVWDLAARYLKDLADTLVYSEDYKKQTTEELTALAKILSTLVERGAKTGTEISENDSETDSDSSMSSETCSWTGKHLKLCIRLPEPSAQL